ncbi:alpha/beta hydrolase family protein [Streptomyces griseofuscus]|uniref:alpha/beta hydrolase family protein n=1 Tax=Streptomyces griseofuscus TaxID=146922 RepID=UPI0036761C5A
MVRARRIWVTAAALCAVAGVSPGVAVAQGQPPSAAAKSASADGHDALPPGWRLTGGTSAPQLEWRSDRPLPVGDARVEFRSGGRLLGVPTPDADGRTFRLALDGRQSGGPHGLAGLGRTDGLQVWSGGRRLDGRTSGGAPASPGSPMAPVSPAKPTPPPQLPANGVDPGKPGAYRTKTGEYTLDSVRLPGFAKPVEMRAVVVAPVGAPGKRPLALFLHGRHSTCYRGDEITIDWPCKSGYRSVPSYRGYLRDQQLLASQGYMTVSIAANGINGQDNDTEDGGAQARSSLIRLHLGHWADWAKNPGSAPAIVRSAPRADLSRVLLVGHSRGGEGVNRAALDSLYPPPADQDGYHGAVRWTVRGSVLIGPTAFGQNPVPDVPSVSVLPGCDGDVSDLEGELYVDGTRAVTGGSALHSAVYVIGADHNFFNSEWTPGTSAAPAEDDFYDDPDRPDPVCGKHAATRLSADRQHRAGSVYIAAAARLFVAGDDRVRPLLDGSGKRAPSADPARVLSHAVGARRGGGFLPDGGVAVSGGRLCSVVATGPAERCLGDDASGSSPHFAQWGTDQEAGRHAIALRWTHTGARTRVTSQRPLSLAGAKDLALRLFVPPNSRGAQFDVTLTDTGGHRATLGRIHADGLPGSERTASYWAREFRVPLTAAGRARVDLRSVKSMELTARSASGRAWVVDAWGWQPGTPAVRAAALPRVDLGRLTVAEGDSGTRTYRVPARVSGHGSGQVRVYVLDPVTGHASDRLVTVHPGGQDIDVPIKVVGNTRYGSDVTYDVLVKAVHNTVVGSYGGGVTVRDDDPAPTMTVTPVANRVTEGQSLTWRVSLSEPVDVDMSAMFAAIAPTTGAELSTKDVPAAWLRDASGESPDPERPLSKVSGLYLWVDIPAHRTSADITLPTVKDKVAEPAESVRFQQLDDMTGEPRKNGLVLEGSVLNAS